MSKIHKARVFEGHKCTTGIHNALFDVVMPELSATTWKILCVLIRQTTGWDREEQGASYTDLMTGTGIKSKTTIAACLDELESYRYHLITIQTGRQHEESRYTINRDVEIEWIPRNFAYSSGSKNEPLGHFSSPENEPKYGSKNEPLSESSGSKNGLSYRKESINLKERGKETAPVSKSITSILVTAYKSIATNYREQMSLQNQAVQLETESCSVADLELWLSSRRSLSSIGFIARDFRTWLVNQLRQNGSTTPKPKRQFCGKCNNGWLAPGKGETYAKECSCVGVAKGVTI